MCWILKFSSQRREVNSTHRCPTSRLSAGWMLVHWWMVIQPCSYVSCIYTYINTQYMCIYIYVYLYLFYVMYVYIYIHDILYSCIDTCTYIYIHLYVVRLCIILQSTFCSCCFYYKPTYSTIHDTPRQQLLSVPSRLQPTATGREGDMA